MLTLTGHISPADKAVGDYLYLPFDVPADAARLDVRYAYSHPRHHGDFDGQGNTIDIGLFDARGHEFLNQTGFRGWSGSDRSHVWVGETDSDTSPGYLSGSLPAGRWHIILGLYRVASEGCDYTVTVEITPRAASLPPAARRASESISLHGPSGGAAPRWYRGDLQSHTHHSDAAGSLATLVASARARGLEFLAVTDHNTISQMREFDSVTAASGADSPLLMPATEVTTYYGHMNVWGVSEWVEFRCRDAHATRAIIAAAHRQGGLVSVNHPKTGGPPWEYGADLDFDCIEVWQAPWPVYNSESFGWWDSLLQQGRRIVAVGGSDYHQPAEVMVGNPHLPGHPTTWVYAAGRTVTAVLDAIRRGRVFISADIDGPSLFFTAVAGPDTLLPGDIAPAGATLDLTCRAAGAAGCIARLIVDGHLADEQAVTAGDWLHTWRGVRPALYARCELILRQAGRADWVMMACSNPIYCERA